MRTDYKFPVWFWDDDTTDEDRHIWMTQDRCRRQAMRQRTGYAQKMEKEAERTKRREEADPATVGLLDYR